jgi:hypothetical protein
MTRVLRKTERPQFGQVSDRAYSDAATNTKIAAINNLLSIVSARSAKTRKPATQTVNVVYARVRTGTAFFMIGGTRGYACSASSLARQRHRQPFSIDGS